MIGLRARVEIGRTVAIPMSVRANVQALSSMELQCAGIWTDIHAYSNAIRLELLTLDNPNIRLGYATSQMEK